MVEIEEVLPGFCGIQLKRMSGFCSYFLIIYAPAILAGAAQTFSASSTTLCKFLIFLFHNAKLLLLTQHVNPMVYEL
jgi:hypothetical protein